MSRSISIILLLTLFSLTGCNGGADRSWQQPKDFKIKRNTEYNSFVANGGLKKQDIRNQSSYQKSMTEKAKRDLGVDSGAEDMSYSSVN